MVGSPGLRSSRKSTSHPFEFPSSRPSHALSRERFLRGSFTSLVSPSISSLSSKRSLTYNSESSSQPTQRPQDFVSSVNSTTSHFSSTLASEESLHYVSASVHSATPDCHLFDLDRDVDLQFKKSNPARWLPRRIRFGRL